MSKIINQNFFNQPAVKVAKALLGKILVRKIGNKKIRLIITEVEAYDGLSDKASHASKGKTERNKIMFKKAGCFYIYFTYGMHYMLNVVTGPKNYPAAILIRGGILTNNKRLTTNNGHKLSVVSCQSINGPAKLTKFLKINKKFNSLKATPKNGLWFEESGIKIKPSQIIAKKRVGVDYAGKIWANKKYNFSLY